MDAVATGNEISERANENHDKQKVAKEAAMVEAWGGTLYARVREGCWKLFSRHERRSDKYLYSG